MGQFEKWYKTQIWASDNPPKWWKDDHKAKLKLIWLFLKNSKIKECDIELIFDTIKDAVSDQFEDD